MIPLLISRLANGFDLNLNKLMTLSKLEKCVSNYFKYIKGNKLFNGIMHEKDMINVFILEKYCKYEQLKSFLSTSSNKM